jgi:hypothetical protein
MSLTNTVSNSSTMRKKSAADRGCGGGAECGLSVDATTRRIFATSSHTKIYILPHLHTKLLEGEKGQAPTGLWHLHNAALVAGEDTRVERRRGGDTRWNFTPPSVSNP